MDKGLYFTNLKHWCGFRRHFSQKSAPVLEIVNFMLWRVTLFENRPSKSAAPLFRMEGLRGIPRYILQKCGNIGWQPGCVFQSLRVGFVD